jgi:hypothetical protein
LPFDPDATSGWSVVGMNYISPVPMPGPDAVAPEVYRAIYPMPMLTIVPTEDLEASKDFWIRGLGFVDLFSMPDQVTHLRRWAFQDVLLVPGPAPAEAPGFATSFSCVLMTAARPHDEQSLENLRAIGIDGPD